ncbi:MAG TPA: hypothetical protein VGR45_02550 [Stellaceae bacterium]|nr:hypothetical protein [Stellaceae bacterium]
MRDRDRSAGFVQSLQIAIVIEAPGKSESCRRSARLGHSCSEASAEIRACTGVASPMRAVEEPLIGIPDCRNGYRPARSGQSRAGNRHDHRERQQSKLPDPPHPIPSASTKGEKGAAVSLQFV